MQPDTRNELQALVRLALPIIMTGLAEMMINLTDVIIPPPTI